MDSPSDILSRHPLDSTYRRRTHEEWAREVEEHEAWVADMKTEREEWYTDRSARQEQDRIDDIERRRAMKAEQDKWDEARRRRQEQDRIDEEERERKREKASERARTAEGRDRMARLRAPGVRGVQDGGLHGNALGTSRWDLTRLRSV